MSSQPVPVHPQERVIRGQLGEPRRRGYTQNNKASQRQKEESSLQRDPEGPSQPHVRPGTHSMSRLSNSKRHQPSVSQPNHL
jgi:hypothetical protein